MPEENTIDGQKFVPKLPKKAWKKAICAITFKGKKQRFESSLIPVDDNSRTAREVLYDEFPEIFNCKEAYGKDFKPVFTSSILIKLSDETYVTQ